MGYIGVTVITHLFTIIQVVGLFWTNMIGETNLRSAAFFVPNGGFFNERGWKKMNNIFSQKVV